MCSTIRIRSIITCFILWRPDVGRRLLTSRVCRSRTPDGPYYDSAGHDMIDCAGPGGKLFDDRTAEQYGVKLIGNYKWTCRKAKTAKTAEALFPRDITPHILTKKQEIILLFSIRGLKIWGKP